MITLEHPDAFAAGVVSGHRLRDVPAAADEPWRVLDNALGFILDDINSDYPRQRAGEYVLGFAAGWSLDHP